MKRKGINFRKKKNDKINYLIEKWYPFAFGIISIVLYFLLLKKLKILDDKDTIINAVISLASILSGFIGTLVGLLFSLNENPIVKYIFEDEHYKKLMKSFFIRVFQSSFVLILCSIVLFFRKTIGNINIQNLSIQTFIEFIKVIWLFSLSYFSMSSYRIIIIIIKIAFNNKELDNSDEELNDEFDKDEYDRIKSAYEIKRD